MLGVFLGARIVSAQFTVGCAVNPELAAQYEAVMGVITLHNNTGQEIELFTSNATCDVAFEVRDQENVVLAGKSDHYLSNPVRLAPTASLVITNNLLNIFDLGKAGSYKVYGRAAWNGKAFISERAFLDIVPGMELQRAESGLPGGGSRVYTLRTLNRERFDRLLIRIDDEAGGVCYGVYDLGRWVHTENPALKVDAGGNVHVLFQSGPVQYVHRVFSPDGVLIEDKGFSQQGSNIRLETTEGGEVKVAGTSNEAGEEMPSK
jgi:hypothetical protein